MGNATPQPPRRLGCVRVRSLYGILKGSDSHDRIASVRWHPLTWRVKTGQQFEKVIKAAVVRISGGKCLCENVSCLCRSQLRFLPSLRGFTAGHNCLLQEVHPSIQREIRLSLSQLCGVKKKHCSY